MGKLFLSMKNYLAGGKLMKHWHYRMPSLKPVTHSHKGGEKSHEHAHLRGYGLKKSSLRIKYGYLTPRQKEKAKDIGMKGLASDLIGYAAVKQVIRLIK